MVCYPVLCTEFLGISPIPSRDLIHGAVYWRLALVPTDSIVELVAAFTFTFTKATPRQDLASTFCAPHVR